MSERVSTTATPVSPSLDEARASLLNFFAEQRDDPASSKRRYDNATRSATVRADNSLDERGFSWVSLVESGLSSWWREHPLHAGALLVKSATVEIAQRKPLQLVAVAAVAGAAIVLLRPWRLVSASALALSLWRSSNFSGMTSDVLQSAVESLQERKP